MPLEGSGITLHGLLGPEQVPYATQIIQPPATMATQDAATDYRWFPAPLKPTPKLPALILPSKQPVIATAKVVQTINLGTRLPVSGTVSENVLGDALHAIFAAEFINPQHPDRIPMIERILRSYGLDQNIKAPDAAGMLDHFAAYLNELFQPKSILVETPFLAINYLGQQTSGYIDLVLETDKGLVIVDHKSFLGGSAEWPPKALSYSGQLAAYCGPRRNLPIASAWIHFAAAGGLVQVAW
jgi:ATP-dependent helicase/nuclease subunit A